MSEIDPEIIKKTQDSLGKFIKKPPLTEKLLSRPPFRFLHDIVTSVISGTGFMKGLFTEVEMNSENVKEKEAKLIFLDKLIGMISLVLNKPVDVKASSIVAGKDSEKTNALLQSLAQAINKKVDNKIFVQKVLNGEAKKLFHTKSNSSVKEKSVDKVKVAEKANEDQKHSDKPKPRKINNNVENTVLSDENKLHQSSKSKKHKEADNNGDKRSKKPVQEKNETEPIKEKDSKTKIHRSKSDKNDNMELSKNHEIPENKSTVEQMPIEILHNSESNLNDEADTESLKRLQRPSSAKGTRQRHENDHHVLSESKEIDNKKTLIRPPSARPAPPKVRKSSDAVLDEGLNILTNQTKVSGIILDGEQDSDEHDFIVEEIVGGGDIDMRFSHLSSENNPEENESHGALVQEIIQSKKKFTTIEEKNEGLSHFDFNRKRERLSNEKEIEKIKLNLQALTKSVHPLGKLIDFLQEDFDTMQKEIDRWHAENNELDKKLMAEQNITNKLIKPLQEKLCEENKSISFQEEAIAKLKAKIESNSKKIDTMLFNVCSSI